MSGPTSADIVCDLRALTDRQRKEQLVASVELIVRGRRAMVELPDGFELQFEPAPGRLAELARWVERESRCCAWMEFAILRSPSGPLRLRLTSSAAGAKETISAGLQAAAALSQGSSWPQELAAPARTLTADDFARVGSPECAPSCGCKSGAAS